MSNTAKSKSWTSPVFPSPAVGVAPVPFAGCQPLFLAFLCLTFLYLTGGEAVSPREEDSDTEAVSVEGEEVGAAAALEVRYSVFEVRGRFLEVLYSVLEVHWSFLELQYSVLEVYCSFLEVQCSVSEVYCCFLKIRHSLLEVHCSFLMVQY